MLGCCLLSSWSARRDGMVKMLGRYLDIAVHNDRLVLAQDLLIALRQYSASADINMIKFNKRSRCNSAIEAAICSGNPEMVSLFLQYGAKLDLKQGACLLLIIKKGVKGVVMKNDITTATLVGGTGALITAEIKRVVGSMLELLLNHSMLQGQGHGQGQGGYSNIALEVALFNACEGNCTDCALTLITHPSGLSAARLHCMDFRLKAQVLDSILDKESRFSLEMAMEKKTRWCRRRGFILLLVTLCIIPSAITKPREGRRSPKSKRSLYMSSVNLLNRVDEDEVSFASIEHFALSIQGIYRAIVLFL
jgi:hypothetical protein